MIIGGLSEKELQAIIALLDSEGISYQVKTDESIMRFNDESMQHNLRHLNSPSISTNVLALELAPEVFETMSENLKASLREYGITDEVPEELFVEDKEIDFVQHEINTGNKRLIGYYMLHSIIVGVIAYIIFWILGH
mgnify:CR=1 FL=1